MNFLFSLLLLIGFSESVMAQESSVYSVEVESRSEWVYPGKVLTAYFVGREAGDLNIRPDHTLVVRPKPRAKIQIINMDGSLTTISFDVKNVKKSSSVKKSRKGYYFKYRYRLDEKDYEDPRFADFDNWGHSFLLNTRVGLDDNLLLMYNTQKYTKDSFLVRYDLGKNWYGSYGDSNFLFNDYRVWGQNFPMLRQGVIGYNGPNLDFEVFSGSKTPAYQRKDAPEVQEDPINGLKTSYMIDPWNLKLFFSNANNLERDIHLNYLGFTKRFNGGHAITATMGEGNEHKNYAWNYRYYQNQKKWTLQRFNIEHQYQGDGVDTIYSSFERPFEKIYATADFYNPEYVNSGTIFLSPRGTYILDTYDQYYEGGLLFGWKNKRVRLFNDIAQGLRHNNLLNTDDKTYALKPGITIYLISKPEERLELTFYQAQTARTYEPAGRTFSTERTGIDTDYRLGNWIYGFGVSRSAQDNTNNQEVAGYGTSAKIGYQKDNFRANISYQTEWLDQNYLGYTSNSYELSRGLFSAGAFYRLNRNHNFSANYQKLNHTMRDMDSFRFVYIFEFGDESKSVSEAMVPARVSASVFVDTNLNGVQDEGEEALEDTKVFLTAKGNSKEKQGGSVSFEGLDRDLYTLTFESENYLFDKNNLVVDLSSNYSSSSVQVAAYPKRTVSLNLMSASSVTLSASVTCGNKSFDFVLNQGNNLLTIPSSVSCEISIDPSSSSGNLGLSDNNFDLQETNKVVVNKTTSILGQVYKDRNSNGLVDDGEGFITTLDFSGQKVSTDKNGYFQFDPKEPKKNFIFNKKDCSLKPMPKNFDEVTKSQRFLLIRCK